MGCRLAASFAVALIVLCGGLGGCNSEPRVPDGIKASSFGWNAEDATACLQKAIDAGATKLVVDRQAGDWIVRPIFVRSKANLEIVVADGVTVRAKSGEFHHINDCLFKFTCCTNVVLRGEGSAKFVMNKKDYHDRSRYSPSEWRHMVNIWECTGVTVSNLELRSSGGDGVYVCDGSKDVKLFNVRCYDHNRQGISIISCEGFYAKNCIFNDTSGTAPMSGSDLEPNQPRDRLTDIVFEDCVFDNNDCYGMQVVAFPLNGTTPPISCMFRRCKARGNKSAAIGVYAVAGKWMTERGPGPVKGTVLFEDCESSGNKGGAMHFRDMVPNGIKVIVRNCRFDESETKDAVDVLGKLPFDFAGLTCENVRVVTGGRPEIAFAPFYGAGASDCHGAITFVNAKDGKETVVDLAKWAAAQPRHPEYFSFKTEPIDYTRLAPATRGKLKEPVETGFIDTKGFTFVQCLPEAGAYELEIEIAKRVPKGNPKNSSYRLVDQLGTDRGTFPLKLGKNKVILRTDYSNVYRLEIKIDQGGKALVRSPYPGCGVEAAEQVWTFGIHKRRYFLVPASATEVRVKVELQLENIGALYDASGRRVDERKAGEPGNRIFLAKRTPTAKDELWSVGFDSNRWLNGYRIGSPALPIAFASPESAMVVRK